MDYSIEEQVIQEVFNNLLENPMMKDELRMQIREIGSQKEKVFKNNEVDMLQEQIRLYALTQGYYLRSMPCLDKTQEKVYKFHLVELAQDNNSERFFKSLSSQSKKIDARIQASSSFAKNRQEEIARQLLDPTLSGREEFRLRREQVNVNHLLSRKLLTQNTEKKETGK